MLRPLDSALFFKAPNTRGHQFSPAQKVSAQVLSTTSYVQGDRGCLCTKKYTYRNLGQYAS